MITESNFTWHRSRIVSIAIIVFGIVAVQVGLDDPHYIRDTRGEQSAASSQQERADAIAGFPVAPHPDAPPRGPGG